MSNVNRELLAPCGLYCGVCAVYIATRDNNEKFRERLVGVYKGKIPGSDDLTVDDIHCLGCRSEEPFLFCRECPFKSCVAQKGYEGCHQCDDFPCAFAENFPLPVGKRVIMRAIPHWREVGTEQYVADEEARYVCPDCGNALFRGARRCNRCKVEVAVD
ncbi:MAG: DUF3795 domain-containing protein [Desulfatibacillaceae bacterium]